MLLGCLTSQVFPSAFFRRALALLHLFLYITFATEDNQDFDYKIRLLVVTGAEPRDGHHRLYRSAMGVKIPAQIVRTDQETEEIPQVLQVIDSSPRDTIFIVTNSAELVVTDEPLAVAWKALWEVVRQRANLLLSFPHQPRIASAAIMDRINVTKSLLKKHRKNSTDENASLTPRTREDLEEARRLLQDLRNLNVLGAQELRKSSPDVSRFEMFAFVGLASSIQEVFLRMQDDGVGSLAQAWHSLVQIKALRQALGVALDKKGAVFQSATTVKAESYQYRYGVMKKVVVQTRPEIALAPFVYAPSRRMPLGLANIMAKEVGCQMPCPECPDEPLQEEVLIDNTENERTPSVLLAVIVERPVAFFGFFLHRLRLLDYPKHRIRLIFHVSDSAASHREQVKEFLVESSVEYQTASLEPEALEAKKALLSIWKLAVDLNVDYLLLVEGNSHLDHPQLLQSLISKRRNVVGPLLLSRDGNHHNLRTGYKDGEFFVSDLTAEFVHRFQSEDGTFNFRGLFQVAVIKGTVLLKQNVFSSMQLNLTTADDQLWETLFLQLISNGYIPYASNVVEYGHPVEENPSLPDIWHLRRNPIDYHDWYLPEEHIFKDSMCKGVRRIKLFNDNFASNLLTEATESSWNKTVEGDLLTVIRPPDGDVNEEATVLVHSVLMTLFNIQQLQQMTSWRGLRVLVGSGKFVFGGEFVLLLNLTPEKVSEVELGEGTSSSCLQKMDTGESVIFRRKKYKVISLVHDASLAVMVV